MSDPAKKRPVKARGLRFPTQKALKIASDGEPEDHSMDVPRAPRPDAESIAWRQEVERAGRRWTSLTPEDLLSLESREVSLVNLIRETYHLSAEEADEQVTSFAQDHQRSTLWAGERESRATWPRG